jgi:hypothetical protein
MTDHSSLQKEKNNTDIVERLEDYAEDDYYFDYKGSLVTTNRPIVLREAFAEITCLREDNKKLSDKAEALRKDAERWNLFTRTASLGFDGSPRWNAVMRFPVFSHDDQTITALVDRWASVYEETKRGQDADNAATTKEQQA